MVPPSTLTSIIPSPTWDPNFGRLDIKDDVLYPKDLTPYTDRDEHIRVALLIITQALPPIASAILLFSQTGWWKRKYQWSFSRLCILWFISIQLFGALVYYQDNASTRTLFLAAGLHLQIEYMMVAMLLKASSLQALVLAYVVGFLFFAMSLFTPDLSIVYISTATLGGTDFLIPILLLYGKQWLYGIGAFSHLISVIAVFLIVVKDYGVVQFSALTFVFVWLNIGSVVFKLLQARSKNLHAPEGDISLPEDSLLGDIKPDSPQQAYDNPLKEVNIPRRHLYLIIGGSYLLSFISSFVFVFVIGK